MPTIDNWRALREALDPGPTAGVTDGPWIVESGRSLRVKTASDETICSTGASDSLRNQWERNAEFIAAAHPAAIRSLLDERDRLAAEVERLKTLAVTKIMLDVVPGEDGMGEEVFAKSVEDVESLLTKMGEKLEGLAAEVEALRGDVVVVIDGYNIRPADVLRRIIRNLKIKKGRTAWGVVSELTAHGSTVSAGLCEWAGIEPDSGHRLTQP